jgi:Bacterial pre-peptidase C-terminal domain
MNRAARARLTGVRMTSAALVVGLFSLLPASVGAQQLPMTRLGDVFPCGARQGATIEVEVHGDEMQGVSGLYYSHPAIKAELLPKADGKPLRFKVTVPAEVPLGYYDVRLVSRLGVSNPRTFVVGDSSEALEQEPNNEQAKAMRIELGTVVNGCSSPAEDNDWYVFSAKAGQRVLVECLGKRIDSNLDGYVFLLDSAGRQLVSNQDDASRDEKSDPLIDFTIPTDGDYYVKLCDFMYNGSSNCFYRLAIGTGPLVDFALPTGAKVGETIPLTVFGRNLPDGEPTDLQIGGRPLQKLTFAFTLAPEAASTLPLNEFPALRAPGSWLDGGAARVVGANGRSNARLIVASSLPEMMEQEPNNAPAEAQRLSGPAAISGQFSPAKDIDSFVFSAKKDEVWSVEVFAQRIGSPADPDLEVLDAKGKIVGSVQDDGDNIGQLRFHSPTRDLRYDLKAPADGDYTIRLEHLFGQIQGGPNFVYRLELTRPTENFQLICAPICENRRDGHVVRQAGRERLDILVWRLHGHNAPITVTAENLPPGVTCDPLTIAPGVKWGTLILTAAADAPIGEGDIKIVGKSTVAGAEVERVVRGGSIVWDSVNTPCVSRMTRSIVLAVRDAAPFKVTATPAGTTLKQGEPLMVTCHVDRRADLPIEIQLSGRGFTLPPGFDVPLTKIAAGANEATLKLATDKIPPATYSIAINGEGQVPFERETAKPGPIRCVLPSNLVTFTILPK